MTILILVLQSYQLNFLQMENRGFMFMADIGALKRLPKGRFERMDLYFVPIPYTFRGIYVFS